MLMQKADSSGKVHCSSNSVHADLHKLLEMVSRAAVLQYESEAVLFVIHCIGINNHGLKT